MSAEQTKNRFLNELAELLRRDLEAQESEERETHGG
jgi:hypothetical protein